MSHDLLASNMWCGEAVGEVQRAENRRADGIYSSSSVTA